MSEDKMFTVEVSCRHWSFSEAKLLVHQAVDAIDRLIDPVAVASGGGGCYYNVRIDYPIKEQVKRLREEADRLESTLCKT